MKWCIASDIHGSAYWCRKTVEAFHREQGDRLLLLGDILYHGPRNPLPDEYNPKKVISLLSSIKDRIFCVRGNCDTEVDQMVLPFPILAPYALLDMGSHLVFATHGHIHPLQSVPPLAAHTILLYGHTHIPCWKKEGELYYFNPGSVSLPKENTPHSYLVVEGNTWQWKDMDGQLFHEENW